MKTLHDYISESETWATTPMPGDDFAIELAPDHLIESYVVETLDDGIVIEADAHAMSLLEEYGCMTETIRRYGPVGSNRGVGFTVAEDKPRFDPLVAKIAAKMQGPTWNDAETALITVLGTSAYNERPGFYSLWLTQAIDKYSKEGLAEVQLTPMWQDDPEHLAYRKKQADISRNTGLAVGDLVTLKDRPGFKGKIVHDWGGGDFTISGSGGGMSQSNNHRANARLIQKMQGVAEGPEESTAEVDRMMELAGIAKAPVEEDNSGLAQKALSLAPVGAMGTEIDEAYGNSIDFQGRTVDRASIELDGVHSWDYPDFSDAYVSYAMFTDGTPLSDDELDQFTDQYGDLVNELAYDSLHEGEIDEAKYHGREVPLGKPMAGDVKKSKVYVRDPATGNIKKVNFGHGGTSAKRAGQKPMHIKKDNPARRKSFRARHNCDNPGPRTKARYWSCRAW